MLCTMSIEVLALLAVLVAAVAGYLLFQRRRSHDTASTAAARERDNLDTVAGWPPEVTRLLSGGERPPMTRWSRLCRSA